jgi:hypothetical protein
MSDDAIEGVVVHFSHQDNPNVVITPKGKCLLGTDVMLPI